MSRQHLPLFGPEGDQRVIADLAVVSHPRAFFATRSLLKDRGVQINGADLAGLARAHLPGDGPQGALEITEVADLEATQKVACRARGDDALEAEDGDRPGIAAQDVEIIQTITAEHQIESQTENALGNTVTALPLLDLDLPIERLGDGESGNKIFHQHGARLRAERSVGEPDLEIGRRANYIDIQRKAVSLCLKLLGQQYSKHFGDAFHTSSKSRSGAATNFTEEKTAAPAFTFWVKRQSSQIALLGRQTLTETESAKFLPADLGFSLSRLRWKAPQFLSGGLLIRQRQTEVCRTLSAHFVDQQ